METKEHKSETLAITQVIKQLVALIKPEATVNPLKFSLLMDTIDQLVKEAQFSTAQPDVVKEELPKTLDEAYFKSLKTIDEAAAMLKRHKRSIYRAIEKELIIPVSILGKTFIEPAEIERVRRFFSK